MTDREIVELLKDARIPRIYRTPEISLSQIKDDGPLVLNWLESDGYKALRAGGALAEVVTRSAQGTRLFYLMARACVLKRMVVHAWHIQEMLTMREQIMDAINEDDVRVIALEGLVGEFPGHLDPTTQSTLTWTVNSWLDARRSVILLNERSIQEAEEFPTRYRDLFAELTTKRFIVP